MKMHLNVPVTHFTEAPLLIFLMAGSFFVIKLIINNRTMF